MSFMANDFDHPDQQSTINREKSDTNLIKYVIEIPKFYGVACTYY